MAVRCVRFADGTDVLNAGGRIYSFCARLRALWGNFPVVVRVHSGACETALLSGAFLLPAEKRRSSSVLFGSLPVATPNTFPNILDAMFGPIGAG